MGTFPTVLVVDDEDGPREALGMVLERSFRVLTADGSAAALRTLADTQVDVAMLDLRMPEMDGIETLRRIRDLDPDETCRQTSAQSRRARRHRRNR